MSVPRPEHTQAQVLGARRSQELAITEGEINFLWSFMQGSIMIPETRNALLRGYGFCERHAWVHISVEMSFRDRYLLAPAILYKALIDKSLRALRAPRRASFRSVMRQLRAEGPCFLCALRVKDASAGAARRERLDQGRDSSHLRSLAAELEPRWRGYVCPACAEEQSLDLALNRCRQHLLTDMERKAPVDLAWQFNVLNELSHHVGHYKSFFSFERGDEIDQDRAALIAAIGWCSGWRPLLALLQ